MLWLSLDYNYTYTSVNDELEEMQTVLRYLKGRWGRLAGGHR